MTPMNKEQRGFKRLLLAGACIVVLMAAAVFAAQWLIADATRKGLLDGATRQGYDLQLEEVSYSLWNNVLTIQGVEATSTLPGMNNIRFANITFQGINRSLAFKALLGKDILSGDTIPLASRVHCRGFDFWPSPEVRIDEQIFESVALDVKQLKKFMEQKEGTSPQANQMQLASTLLCANSISRNLHIQAEAEPNTKLVVSVASQHVEGVRKGYVEKTSVEGLRFRRANENNDMMRMERIVFNKISLDQAIMDKLASPSLQEEERNRLALSLFLGERPLIAQIDMDGLWVDVGGIPVTLGTFRWKNPQTSPFSCTLKADHLKLPLSFFPDFGYLSLIGISELDLNFAFSGLFQPASSQKPTEIRLDTTANGLGSLSFGTRCLVDKPIGLSELAQDDNIDQNIRVQSLQLSFSEGGLLARIARIGKQLFRVAPENIPSFITEQLWFFTPEKARNEKNFSLILKVNEFLKHPGRITFVVTPDKPVSLGNIEAAMDQFLTIEVEKSVKSIQDMALQ